MVVAYQIGNQLQNKGHIDAVSHQDTWLCKCLRYSLCACVFCLSVDRTSFGIIQGHHNELRTGYQPLQQNTTSLVLLQNSTKLPKLITIWSPAPGHLPPLPTFSHVSLFFPPLESHSQFRCAKRHLFILTTMHTDEDCYLFDKMLNCGEVFAPSLTEMVVHFFKKHRMAEMK